MKSEFKSLAVKIRIMLCMDISIKMNLSLVKEALSLKGLVDQDCMTVCTTSDIQI